MGKQPKSEQPATTRMIRARNDLADMFGWICKVQGVNSADLLDRMLRRQVEEEYAASFTLIAALKQSEDAFAVRNGAEPGPPLPQVPIRVLNLPVNEQPNTKAESKKKTKK